MTVPVAGLRKNTLVPEELNPSIPALDILTPFWSVPDPSATVELVLITPSLPVKVIVCESSEPALIASAVIALAAITSALIFCPLP